MIHMPYLTRERVITSLNSTVCPVCGGAKGRGKTMCFTDYAQLTGDLKRRLYHRVGQGYEEALHDALAYLMVETFHESRAEPRAGSRP